MAKPERSIRLERRSAKSLNTLSGARGEIFYDADNATLRLYVDNAGSSVTFAEQQWVLDNKFSGSYTDLTDKPSAFANLDFIGCQFGTTVNEFSTDGTLIDDSDDAVPTEHAVKTYVDSSIANAVGGIDITSALDDLTDVVVTTPIQDQILRFNGTTWINETVQGFQDTNTEYSVTAATATGGALLQLVGSDASVDYIKFEEGSNVSIARIDPSTIQISSAVGSLALADLSNVSTLSPATGQVLKWDGTQWAPAADATLGGAGLDADTLDGQDGTYYLNYNNFSNVPTIPTGLTDLGIIDGTNGQVLTTDGAGSFTFTTVTGGAGALSDLSDVDTTGVADGSVLKYSTTTSTWIIGTDNAGTGSAYDQDLNTTDDVTFNSVIAGTVNASTYTNSGTGAPSITSASTITLDAPDGTIVQNGPFRLPSLTTTEKNALTAVNGDMVYDSTLNKAQVYENGAWVSLV